MSDGKKLIITDEDLSRMPASTAAPMPPIGAPGAPAAGALPPVAGVKPAPLQLGGMTGRSAAGGLNLRSTLVMSTIGALVAALAAWLLLELITDDNAAGEHLVRTTALQFGAAGAVFGAIYAAWEDLTSRVWEAALPAAGIGAAIGAVCGAISGAIAQELYASIIRDIVVQALTTGDDISATDFKLCAARALAWAIFGAGIGLAAGAAKRSGRKTVNALVGGTVGAAIGGFLFNYIGEATDSATASRLIGLAVVGLAMGAAIGLVETARRQAWIKLVSGGMAGKEFILYHANTIVGSSPKAQITLIKDPAVAPMHFRIDEQGPRRALTAFDGCPVSINGTPVTSHWLRDGDMVQVGGTAFAYSERTVAGV
ncbi:FHA domain-containing protein [Candidatus Solirubrobacter pratensis]|uniref:FHA domain-containing protein n=1 Tax=Candidatus Solirubrobacter pratensis TaxID=1298857 RepID=UPI0003FF9579|nr:FHA domain-containing protein [Candidatus Solirubrobacter pratensis]